MKKLTPVILAVALALSVLGVLGTRIYQAAAYGGAAPEILFASDVISVPTGADDAALLAGVTATDAEDGDVTASLLVEGISGRNDDGTVQVTYAAFDSNHHVTKATRAVRYTDYTKPRFALTQPLVCRTGGNRVHGDANARRDRSANVITVLIDDVDIGRGAKVHHDCRRAVESFGRNGVGDAIGTYGPGARRAQLGHRGRLRPDDDGVRGNAVGHGVPFARELRHHAGEGDRVDRVERKAVHLKETHQAHMDLVGGIGAVGGHAPRLHQLVSVKQAHGRLRVSHIDSEQHVYSQCWHKRTRTIVYVLSAALSCDSFTAIWAEGF